MPAVEAEPAGQSAPANGWWAVRNSDGTAGIVKGSTPGAQSVAAVYIGAANSINELATKFGTKLSNAIGSIGASGAQQATLIGDIDTAAGKNPSTAKIFAPASSPPGTNATATDASGNPVSSVPSGDATAAGVNLSFLNDLGSIWGALSNPSNWLRGLEILGAVVAIYLGLRSLTGAPGIIETAEKVKP